MTIKEFFSFRQNKLFWINIAAMIVVAGGCLFGVLKALDAYTRHGEAVVVPDVKGLSLTDAQKMFVERGLKAVVADSSYVKNLPAGCVLDYNPVAGQRVKQGRTVYLTINALSPRKVTIPELKNLSYRQAEAIVKGLGMAAPQIIYWNSEYKDLVLNVMADGRPVEAGDRLPVTARITFSVGNGIYAPTRKMIAPKDSLAADSLRVDSLSQVPSLLPPL